MPHSDRYAIDSRPPAYRRFKLHPDGSIDTEVRWIESQSMPLTAASR